MRRLTGSGTTRDGRPDATISKAGVTAQKLRYVDLLLTAPWSLAASASQIEALGIPDTTRIPNPVSFLVQKLLIHPYRTPAKRAQDVLYVHDTLELFSGQFDTLHTLWYEELKPTVPARTLTMLQESIPQQFGVVTDVVRQAARIPQDRLLTPDRIRRTCLEGMQQLLNR
ncbi:MAG: GSU2403 family nucleotidyltransferase fold protein [Gemmatimonadaceae bacterium]